MTRILTRKLGEGRPGEQSPAVDNWRTERQAAFRQVSPGLSDRVRVNKERADIKEATNQTPSPTSAFQVVIATQDISHVGQVTSTVHTTTGCGKQGFPSAQLYLSHILTALGWGSVTLAIVLQEIIRQRLELWSTFCPPRSK